jgi:vitamin B12 transporter
MIERMEVLKGGQGLMYGTQAIAGVVNVVTRGFSGSPEGSVTLGAGSHDLLRFNGYRSGSVGDHKYVFWAPSTVPTATRLTTPISPLFPRTTATAATTCKAGGSSTAMTSATT